ncbi:MAG: hypothetical protein ABFE13_25025 [Phycisphaerales bacterium]
MDRSQWVSLVFVGLLIVVDVFVLAPAFQSNAESGNSHFPRQQAGEFLAVVACAAIWWPDMVGAVFLLARFGPLPDSWTPVVRCLGWIVLFVVAMMRVQYIRQVF